MTANIVTNGSPGANSCSRDTEQTPHSSVKEEHLPLSASVHLLSFLGSTKTGPKIRNMEMTALEHHKQTRETLEVHKQFLCIYKMPLLGHRNIKRMNI